MINKCKICSLFEEKQLIEEVKFDINKQIKQRQSLDILNKQTGFNLSEYHYKKHLNTCLSNLDIPFEEKIIETKIQTNNSHHDILKTNIIIEDYRKKTLTEKQEHKLKLLDEIELLVVSTVHHELINGRFDKGFIPKDDITSLKIINDVMKGKSENDNKENNYNEYENLSSEKLSKIDEILNEK